MKHALSLLLTSMITLKATSGPYLFKKFPQLQAAIPHLQLCDLPTPIIKLQNFGNQIGCKNIFI